MTDYNLIQEPSSDPHIIWNAACSLADSVEKKNILDIIKHVLPYPLWLVNVLSIR